MEYVIVFLLGCAVAIVPAFVWASSQRRPAAATPAVCQAQPAAPIIVLPPAPQPVTHNYTEIYNDNRTVVVHADQRTPAGAQLVTEQLSLAQYQQPQRERRFKVVGEREEWKGEL